MAFPLKDDGTLGEGRVFADASSHAKAKKKGLPDGLKVDRAGNLWASSKDGISIFTPAGKRIGIIRADDVISNCELAADGHLYMSSNHRVVRVRIKARKLAV
jgi:sugar lactone lactonase YvrE